MNILLAAATEAEIAPLIKFMDASFQKASDGVYSNGGNNIRVCVTGVGMVAATFSLTDAVCNGNYDLAVQAGIGGSFDRAIPLGSVVYIKTEQFGDLGAEDKGNFIDIFKLGFVQKEVHPFSDGRLDGNPGTFLTKINLPAVAGLTVNTVSGSEATIQRRADEYNCTTESMEGAAFHYVCLMKQLPFIQLRGISNYVEPRNRENWKIKEAVIALNDRVIQLLEAL